jgi:hypothetical protein
MKLEIAGKTVEDADVFVADYLRKHERAIREFDLGEMDGGPNRVTAQDILLTRYTPVRIDSGEIQYFVDASHAAPWRDVPPDARLVDADPNEEGGLYDAAEGLYMHFYNGRRRGISPAKIHTVLHMKRRDMYPILDGRIEQIYEESAKAASKRVEGRRGRRGRLYWAAIRLDLIENEDGFAALREKLGAEDEPASLGAQLTDLRLLDIVCWSLVTIRR